MITDSFRQTVHNALVQINDYFRVILESELGTLRDEIIKEEGIDYEYGCKVLTMDIMKEYLRKSIDIHRSHSSNWKFQCFPSIINFNDISFDVSKGIFTYTMDENLNEEHDRYTANLHYINYYIRNKYACFWSDLQLIELYESIYDEALYTKTEDVGIAYSIKSDEKFQNIVNFLNDWSKNKPKLNKAIKQKVKDLKSDWEFKEYINTNFNARREEMNHIDLVSFHV